MQDMFDMFHCMFLFQFNRMFQCRIARPTVYLLTCGRRPQYQFNILLRLSIGRSANLKVCRGLSATTYLNNSKLLTGQRDIHDVGVERVSSQSSYKIQEKLGVSTGKYNSSKDTNVACVNEYNAVDNPLTSIARELVQATFSSNSLDEVFTLLDINPELPVLVKASDAIKKLILIEDVRKQSNLQNAIISSTVMNELLAIMMQNVETVLPITLAHFVQFIDAFKIKELEIESQLINEFEKRIATKAFTLTDLCIVRTTLGDIRYGDLVIRVLKHLCDRHSEINASNFHQVTAALAGQSDLPLKVALRLDQIVGNRRLRLGPGNISNLCQLFASSSYVKMHTWFFPHNFVNRLNGHLKYQQMLTATLEEVVLFYVAFVPLHRYEMTRFGISLSKRLIFNEDQLVHHRSLQLAYAQFMISKQRLNSKILLNLCRDFRSNSGEYSDRQLATLLETLGYFVFKPNIHREFFSVLDVELRRRLAGFDPSLLMSVFQSCAFLGVLYRAAMFHVWPPLWFAKLHGEYVG